jgi:hypothetical protein
VGHEVQLGSVVYLESKESRAHLVTLVDQDLVDLQEREVL